MQKNRTILPFIIACIILTALLALRAAATSTPLDDYELKALDLINNDRQKYRLKPLKQNLALAELARQHASDMMEKNYFSHDNLEGKSPFDRIKKAGIRYTAAGENLYKGLNDPIGEDVEIAEQFLMSSPSHRRNILDRDFTEVGIGIVRSQDGWMYLVQCFIRP